MTMIDPRVPHQNELCGTALVGLYTEETKFNLGKQLVQYVVYALKAN